MTLLTYNSKYLVQSATTVTTSSSTLSDDTPATRTFSLASTKTVLIIYTANSEHLSTNGVGGIKNAINVDGTDVSQMNDSGYAANRALRNTCIWVGSLNSGSHTINGRLASAVNAQTTTVDNRTLLIYIFNGDEFRYIDDPTAQTATSTTYIDDSVATTTFTPSGGCKALAFYAITNLKGSTERYDGKKICINIDGVDQYGEAAKSSNSAVTSPDSLATVYVQALTAVSTTIKGRLATNAGTQTVTASRHVLGVLLLDPSVVLDSVASVTPRSRALTTLADDDQASITRVRGATNELLIFGQATKQYGTTGSMYGLCYGLNVDDADVALSRSSPAYTSDAESSFVTYATTVAAGSHTINGRFATNYSDVASIVDTRILIALWFNPATIIQVTSSMSGGGSLTASLSNIKRIVSSVTGGGALTAVIHLPIYNHLLKTNELYTIKTSDGFYLYTSDTTPSSDLSSSITGGGFEVSNPIKYNYINSTITGGGSSTTALFKFGRIASSIAGGGARTAIGIVLTYLPIISSISAAASQTANVIEYEKIGSSVVGGGSQTAFVIKFEHSTVYISGGGSETSNIIKYNYIISSVVGGGSQTSNPITFERMVSSRTGVGSQTAAIIEFTHLPVSFSISGGGSETATIKELEQIISFINGGGSQASNPITFELISSILASTGALTADVQLNTGTVNLYSFRTGSGSETANIIEFEKITSTVTGVGGQNAALSSNQIITSYISGMGASTANIREWNYMSSNIFGVGFQTSDIIEWNYMSSNIFGVGSQTSDIALLEYMESVISGFGSTQAAVSINKNIYSVVSGSGSQTADDIVFDLLSGIVLGFGHSSAHLTVIIIATPHFDHPQTLIINQNIRVITIFRNDRTVMIEDGLI